MPENDLTLDSSADFSGSLDYFAQAAPLTPGELGGTPVVMPSNDDWAKSFSALGNAVSSRVAGIVTQLASNVKNPPPGGAGVNVQAATVVGGKVQPFIAQMQKNAGGVLVLALVAAIIVALARR